MNLQQVYLSPIWGSRCLQTIMAERWSGFREVIQPASQARMPPYEVATPTISDGNATGPRSLLSILTGRSLLMFLPTTISLVSSFTFSLPPSTNWRNAMLDTLLMNAGMHVLSSRIRMEISSDYR